MVLNTGTAIKTPRPSRNMVLRSKEVVGAVSLALCTRAGGTTGLPRKTQAITHRGTSMFTIEAMKTPWMMARVVTWPPIHNMVVVTSPIGVQAPPALAAMMMMPAKNKRSSRRSSNFFISETITMVVVRLSRIALRKKVTKPTSHIRLESCVVRIREVMTSKPLCASTTSTMVMAPIRKKTI